MLNNSQQDTRWSTIVLGNSTLTIGLYGCVISVLGNAVGATPDVVNALLKSVGGFDGALVLWSKVQQAFPGITAEVHTTYDNDAVLSELGKGNRVLVFVSAAPIGGTGEHCVEYIGQGHCKDPWTGAVRLTSDFPGILGEWVSIAGTWQSASQQTVSTILAPDGLNTYGLDPKNEASNQVVFDTWHQVVQGLYVPLQQFNAQKTLIENLQGQINDLQSKHNEDQREIVNLNSSLQDLSSSNKDYVGQAISAEKVAGTYTSYMDDVASNLDLIENNQTDAQLHDEIIKEIVTLRQNQKTPESEIPLDKTLTTWAGGFKNIVDWILQHGFNDFLKENNLQVVDLEGNPQDDTIGDKVIAFLDSQFSQISILQKAQDSLMKMGQKINQNRIEGVFSKLIKIFITTA